jgi:tetratricopeptide (TPR) repeat protein
MTKFAGRSTDTLISCLANLGVLMARLDRDKEAESFYREAVTAARELVARIPSEPHNNHLLAVSLGNLADVQYNRGDVAGAIGHVEEAIGHQEVALKSMPWSPKCAQSLVNHYGVLAEWLANAENVQLRDTRRALELARKALKLAPDSRDTHVTLGVALYRAGDARAAITEMERGLALEEVEEAPTVTTWFFLAMSHAQLGDQRAARRWYDRAVAWIDKNPEHKEGFSRWRAEATALLDKPRLEQPNRTSDK